MPGGRDGTDISKVLNPTSLSQRTNQSSSLCLGWRNQMPFPAKGRVPGGLLLLRIRDSRLHSDLDFTVIVSRGV